MHNKSKAMRSIHNNIAMFKHCNTTITIEVAIKLSTEVIMYTVPNFVIRLMLINTLLVIVNLLVLIVERILSIFRFRQIVVYENINF